MTTAKAGKNNVPRAAKLHEISGESRWVDKVTGRMEHIDVLQRDSEERAATKVSSGSVLRVSRRSRFFAILCLTDTRASYVSTNPYLRQTLQLSHLHAATIANRFGVFLERP